MVLVLKRSLLQSVQLYRKLLTERNDPKIYHEPLSSDLQLFVEQPNVHPHRPCFEGRKQKKSHMINYL